MSKQKTAVEWLLNKVWDLDDENFTVPNRLIEMIEQAKEMENEQIIVAYQQGFNNAYFSNPLSKEQYYNETYTQS